MQLDQLLDGIFEGHYPQVFSNYDVSAIFCDSRKVTPKSLFVATKGFKSDGAEFIGEAVKKGARVIIHSKDSQVTPEQDVCYLPVDDPHVFLRQLAGRFYGNFSEKVKVIGVTGTNGKTTVTYLIESILHEASTSCGVIGTVNYRVGAKSEPSVNTTPGFLEIQQLLAGLESEGADYCVMEVSSHALDQGRVDLIDFHCAVFTNLTKDHLDYHQTQENYFAAKSKLFTGLSADATAVINADDSYATKIISKTAANVVTYGAKNNADVMAVDIQLDIKGARFKLVCSEGELVIRTKLVGAYNIYNILAAAAACLSEGISLDIIRAGIEDLPSVVGRLEEINCGQDYSIFVDYAHTQDALEHVLTTIRQTTDARIILVFGCGGDRDKTKRPAMGAVADQLADFAIVTTDNPRSEDPQAIIDQILEGMESDKHRVIVDRQKAIEHALNMAEKGDVVLITGKGHETYQIFSDQTIKFDERQIIQKYLMEHLV